jgi:hypothetical protein
MSDNYYRQNYVTKTERVFKILHFELRIRYKNVAIVLHPKDMAYIHPVLLQCENTLENVKKLCNLQKIIIRELMHMLGIGYRIELFIGELGKDYNSPGTYVRSDFTSTPVFEFAFNKQVNEFVIIVSALDYNTYADYKIG